MVRGLVCLSRCAVQALLPPVAAARPGAAAAARKAQNGWSLAGGEFRAARLERAADLLEERDALFLGLAIDEAGKTLVDAIAEVREAVDFLRYYALQARELIKCAVQQGCELTACEALDELCARVHAEPVQCIGRRFVMYRESRQNKRIEL